MSRRADAGMWSPRTVRLLGAVLVTLGLGTASAADPTHAEIRTPPTSAFQTTLSAGFDSFGDSYSIDDADTLDVTNEMRSLVGLKYSRKTRAGHRLEAFNTFGISDQAVRNALRLGGKFALSRRASLDIGNELTVKRFGDEFTVASDHVHDVLRTTYRFEASEAATLSTLR